MIVRERLKKIADLVEEPTVFDVGCDHALLDIYLVQKKQVHAIASDCNENAYRIALHNVAQYQLEDQIMVRLTEGTKGLSMIPNATLVLAGMGTSTMIHILKETELLPNQLILQSNHDLTELRKYVVTIGYYIDKEEIVKEGKIYNVILSCKKGNASYDEIDYELGPIIRKAKRKEDRDYLNFLLNNHKKILESLPKNKVELIRSQKEKMNAIKNELNH